MCERNLIAKVSVTNNLWQRKIVRGNEALNIMIWAVPLENQRFAYAKNKGADQLYNNCKADQQLYYHTCL